ncbi:hypothetical protein BWQ96_01278 [Gracilariopsis chorda]|uniref:BZIP domain-containing protein n=1 Tax=Gracilariopsis chorda TaxID=448386 RepID=A0A2V3J3A9_9FLOR|nr:hypothetical protein BWQ96_01278 [Gracilariopsis chorda]|eukprot:PXF48936.1 hypothetical protein BWQ96_01278 [Gracilariopsis chorda]
MGSPISNGPSLLPVEHKTPIAPPVTKPRSTRSSYSRAPIAKPTPAEEELVRKIHRKVGGPSKLSTYDDPAKVRHVVIEALATEQLHADDTARIRRGQLSVFERRVVRTVTNRGAAVRSRMRQRRQVAQLKHELRLRDVRVRQLEGVVRVLCAKYAVPLPLAILSEQQQIHHLQPLEAHAHQAQAQPILASPLSLSQTTPQKAHHESETESVHSGEQQQQQAQQQQQQQQHQFQALPQSAQPNYNLDPDLLGNLVNQIITTHSRWM